MGIRWYLMVAGFLLVPTVAFAQSGSEVPPVIFTGPLSNGPGYEVPPVIFTGPLHLSKQKAIDYLKCSPLKCLGSLDLLTSEDHQSYAAELAIHAMASQYVARYKDYELTPSWNSGRTPVMDPMLWQLNPDFKVRTTCGPFGVLNEIVDRLRTVNCPRRPLADFALCADRPEGSQMFDFRFEN